MVDKFVVGMVYQYTNDKTYRARCVFVHPTSGRGVLDKIDARGLPLEPIMTSHNQSPLDWKMPSKEMAGYFRIDPVPNYFGKDGNPLKVIAITSHLFATQEEAKMAYGGLDQGFSKDPEVRHIGWLEVVPQSEFNQSNNVKPT